MTVSHKILFWCLLLCAFLSACSSNVIREESITLHQPPALTLPVQAPIAVHVDPDKINKQHIVNHLFSQFRFEEGVIIQRAAIKVLNRAFVKALPSGDLPTPNWLAEVSGSMHVDTFFGSYNAEAHLDLYDSSNKLIGSFDGKGTSVSGTVNDSNAFENSYIKAFVQIADVMLRDESVIASLRNGNPPRYAGHSGTAPKASWPIATPLTKAPTVKLPEKKATIQRQPRPQLHGWAIIIGVSEYRYAGRNGLENLIFADDDARAFARALRDLGWSESHLKLLVNKEATQRNIMIALESWLTKAGSDDQIVLFWAGHGFPDPEDPEKVYFACYDTDLTIPATGYRMDRVRLALEEKRARNVVVFADTCHAGKLITRGQRGISIVPKIDKMRREKTIPKGWIFMVGAETDRKAIEHTSWSNGAFTHCLVEALYGKADGFLSSGADDGIITMGELRTYMNIVMPDETQKVIGIAKRPVITTSAGDPDIWNLVLEAR